MKEIIVKFVETIFKTMDVQAVKLQFIEQYIKISDESIIEKLHNTLKEELSNKTPISLSDEEKKAIDKGHDDIKNGRILSGEQVKERMRNKYPNLLK